MESIDKLREYKGEKVRRSKKVKFLDKLKENGKPVDETTRELKVKPVDETTRELKAKPVDETTRELKAKPVDETTRELKAKRSKEADDNISETSNEKNMIKNAVSTQ